MEILVYIDDDDDDKDDGNNDYDDYDDDEYNVDDECLKYNWPDFGVCLSLGLSMVVVLNFFFLCLGFRIAHGFVSGDGLGFDPGSGPGPGLGIALGLFLGL